MFSTANCSALIFLAVPLAELFFVFLFFFFISIIAKEKASFFSFDKAVYLIALPHQNLNAPPLCGKKKFMTSVFSRMLIRICSYYLSQHFLEKYCETS